MKALCLSGGGSKGAFQVGVLRKLLDQDPNLDYDLYAGISVGALNASFLATGSLNQTLPKLENIWLREIKGNKSIWKHNLFFYVYIFVSLTFIISIIFFIAFILELSKIITVILGVFSALSLPCIYILINIKKISINQSIYKTKPLRSLIKKYLDVNKLKNGLKKLRIGAVSYQTGEYKAATEKDENIIEWIMASSAYPIFFPMSKIEGKYWTDGGLVNTVPFQDAILAGATEIDIILTSTLDIKKVSDSRLLSQIERVINIMTHKIMINSIAEYSEKNNVKVRIFLPKKNFNINPLSFKPDEIKKMYESDFDII